MYFYKKQGKQYLDLTGNLILSHNDNLVKARVKSAGPASIRNVKYITNISNLSVYFKIKATWAVIRFIWGPNTALIKDD